MENQQPDKKKDESKELKKLIESHMAVATHRLGRAPTIDELVQHISGDGQDHGTPIGDSVQPAEKSKEPKILSTKVYYGMKTQKSQDGQETRQADPGNVLFYEGHDGRVFDTTSQSWMEQRPPVLDHLNQRPLVFDEKNQDIMRAIMHGVIDDEDFGHLDSAGMVNEDCKKVFGLYKKALDMTNQLTQLEKSEPVETDDDALPTVDDGIAAFDLDAEPAPSSGGMIGNFFDTAGVSRALDEVEAQFGEQGRNVFTELLAAAMADVDEKTKAIVRHELEMHLTPIIEALEHLSAHVGLTASNDQQGEDTFYQPPELDTIP
jgi:hypothetical protein